MLLYTCLSWNQNKEQVSDKIIQQIFSTHLLSARLSGGQTTIWRLVQRDVQVVVLTEIQFIMLLGI